MSVSEKNSIRKRLNERGELMKEVLKPENIRIEDGAAALLQSRTTDVYAAESKELHDKATSSDILKTVNYRLAITDLAMCSTPFGIRD